MSLAISLSGGQLSAPLVLNKYPVTIRDLYNNNIFYLIRIDRNRVYMVGVGVSKYSARWGFNHQVHRLQYGDSEKSSQSTYFEIYFCSEFDGAQWFRGRTNWKNKLSWILHILKLQLYYQADTGKKYTEKESLSDKKVKRSTKLAISIFSELSRKKMHFSFTGAIINIYKAFIKNPKYLSSIDITLLEYKVR